MVFESNRHRRSIKCRQKIVLLLLADNTISSSSTTNRDIISKTVANDRGVLALEEESVEEGTQVSTTPLHPPINSISVF
jgi:hypothetical protein